MSIAGLGDNGAKHLGKSSGQVTEALDNLDCQIGQLTERVRALVAQLAPVMRPEAPKDTAEEAKALAFDVQIAASIQANSIQLSGLSALLTDAIDRLSL